MNGHKHAPYTAWPLGLAGIKDTAHETAEIYTRRKPEISLMSLAYTLPKNYLLHLTHSGVPSHISHLMNTLQPCVTKMHLKSQTRIYNVLKKKEKNVDCSRISIITSRGQHQWVERFLKTASTNILF